MSTAHDDHRAPGTARLLFDGMVEVRGELGPTFEAQAVNLSEEGMSLRTAYLPEIGQRVMCRFEGGEGLHVRAEGEVLWNKPHGGGGEFGIRFNNLDGASTVALQRMMGMAEDEPAPQPEPGRKVRLHIDGLASPMRARIKDQMASGVTAYSDLGFLQMGRPLELEDAVSGNRRPALIDRVEVAVDGASRIPQLVVSLRYDDADGRAASTASSLAAMEVPVDPDGALDDEDDEVPPSDPAPHDAQVAHAAHLQGSLEPHAMEQHVEAAHDSGDHEGDEPGTDEEPSRLKSAFVRNAAKITPAILGFAKRAKATAALLAARARKSGGAVAATDDVEVPVRRTTAPAPGGGLHASGRKVVRGESLGSIHEERFEDETVKPRFTKAKKKKAALAASVALALVLVFFALRKPAPAPQLASAPPADETTAAATPATPAPVAPPAPIPPPTDPLAAAAAAGVGKLAKGGKPVPFTNGPVGSHPAMISAASG